MWVFTEDGFFSVVQYKAAKDPFKNEGHYKLAMANEGVDYVLVRARIKADLEQVQSKTKLDLHIQTDPKADYAHRALMTKGAWAAYMTESILNIDYDSHFKEVVRDRAPEVKGRYNAMMSVWSAFARLQDFKPYGGSSYGGFSDDWENAGYLSRGNNSTTTGTVTGGGYPWDRGKNKPTGSYKPLTTTTTKTYSEELILSDTYVEVNDMAKLLLKYSPQDVPQSELDNVDDDAFALWLAADDATVGEDTTIAMDKAAVEEIAGELGFTINWDE